MGISRRLQDLYDRLLVANLRRCCICQGEEQLQIHHIDGNHQNDVWENLAVLCLRHHGRVSGDEGFGRSYPPSEVRLWKKKWEAKCAALDADEGEEQQEDAEPFTDERQTISIDSEEWHEFSYDLQAGDVLTVKVVSDVR